MNMNTSPTTTCPLAKEIGTEIISPTGPELTSISLDVEQANDDASASAVDASPKAKTMKQVLLICGRGLAVSVVIALALAGKGFVARAHNDPPGTDYMMMNADFSKDSSKQVALLELGGDGNNVAGYDFTKVDGGVSTVRTLEQAQDPIIYEFTKVGDGVCLDSTNNFFDMITFIAIADVDACKAKCEECPGQGQAAGRELRGFYYVSNGECQCLLDNGDSFLKSDCTGAFNTFTSGIGTGAICNLIPAPVAECWKVVDSTLQCPTPAPTNEPTQSPSMAPSAPPSMAPTASPTAPPSMAPTASPQDPIVYEFTKVGDGNCRDSNNNYFDSIYYSGIADVDACKAKCEECPGQGQAAGRKLRGFYFHYVNGGCYCYLDDGDLFNESDCTGTCFTSSTFTGTGAICNIITNTFTDGECWKVVDSSLQCPTPEPTKEPTSSSSRSPTQSPSMAPSAPPSMAPTASPTAPPMALTETPTKTPTAPPTPTAQPNSAPTKASAKSGKSGGGKKLW